MNMIANDIKQFRKTFNLNQKQMAELLDSSEKYISMLENGHKNAGPEITEKFNAVALQYEFDRIKEPESNEDIAIKLKQFRKKNRLYGKDIARLIGTNSSYISHIETGLKQPGQVMKKKLKKLFKTKISFDDSGKVTNKPLKF
jgi:transcriptional regulator with XRE-family HTH domain